MLNTWIQWVSSGAAPRARRGAAGTGSAVHDRHVVMLSARMPSRPVVPPRSRGLGRTPFPFRNALCAARAGSGGGGDLRGPRAVGARSPREMPRRARAIATAGIPPTRGCGRRSRAGVGLAAVRFGGGLRATGRTSRTPRTPRVPHDATSERPSRGRLEPAEHSSENLQPTGTRESRRSARGSCGAARRSHGLGLVTWKP